MFKQGRMGMFSNKEYKIFISHSWSHDKNFHKIIQTLDSFRFFKYVNTSIPSSEALDVNNKQLTERLITLIEQAEVVVFANDHTSVEFASKSEWIKHEMVTAWKLNKPILVVKPAGAAVMPGFIFDAAEKIVTFEYHDLAKEIKKLAKIEYYEPRNPDKIGQSGALKFVHDMDLFE